MRLLKRNEVADMLGICPELLNSPKYREKIGLPYVRIGRSIRYRQEDVEQLIQALPPFNEKVHMDASR